MERIVTKDERKALRRFVTVTVAYALQCLVALAAMGIALHVYNLYPQFHSRMKQKQQDGLDIWTMVCKEGSASMAVKSSHVDCRGAFQKSEINPTMAALEEICLHLLRDANLFRYLIPDPASPLGYVFLKTVDALVSNVIMLGTIALVLLLWFQWSFYRGPYSAYSQYAQRKEWSKSPVEMVQTQGEQYRVPVDVPDKLYAPQKVY